MIYIESGGNLEGDRTQEVKINFVLITQGGIDMEERFSWKRITSAGLAAFVVFIMILSSFVGAVGSIENSEPKEESGGADGIPDSPGTYLDGITESSEYPGALEIPPELLDGAEGADGADRPGRDSGREPLSGSENVVDKASEEIMRENKRESHGVYGESTVAEDRFNEIGVDNNVVSYNGILTDIVKQYVISAEVSSVEGADHKDGADIATNLYTTVNDYLEDDADDREPEYMPPLEKLSTDGLTSDKEIIEMRDDVSRSFRNDDGTVTAVIFDKPIHYQDAENNWQLIDTNLEIASDGGYENLKNSIRSSFDFDSSEVIVDLGSADRTAAISGLC
jgi:hypothetical protein